MKKLFAGLLLGTMVLGAQSTVFAATDVQGLNLTAKLVDFTGTQDVQELSKILLSTDNKGEMIAASSTIAMTIEDLTPEQKVEMEKVQKEFEDKVKEVCKEAGYDYNTIMDKMQKGTLAEEEQEVLSQAGVMMSTSIQVCIPAEVLTPGQIAEMEKTQKEFDTTISEAAKTIKATIITDTVEQ